MRRAVYALGAICFLLVVIYRQSVSFDLVRPFKIRTWSFTQTPFVQESFHDGKPVIVTADGESREYNIYSRTKGYPFDHGPLADTDLLPTCHDPDTYDMSDPNEKFMSFVLHSGFNNQRLGLENALAVAYYLNRTLILPATILGYKPVSMHKYPEMSSRIHKMEQRLAPGFIRAWDEIVDFGDIIAKSNGRLRIICAKEMYTGPAMARMGLMRARDVTNNMIKLPTTKRDPGAKVDVEYILEDLNVPDDKVRVAYRLWDSDEFDENGHATTPAAKVAVSKGRPDGWYKNVDIRQYIAGQVPSEAAFNETVDLPSTTSSMTREKHDQNAVPPLKSQPRLVQFGSLFGWDRVIYTRPVGERMLYEIIKTNLLPRHPLILQAADYIITEYLGGWDNYVGMHLRAGDSGYLAGKAKVLEAFRSTLNMLKLNNGLGIPATEENDNPPVQRRETCLYIATDVADPVTDLAEIRKDYPCTLTWADVSKDLYPGNPLLQTSVPALAALPLMDTYDSNKDASVPRELRQWYTLTPVIEALISSGGSRFFGTHGSTFSQFADRCWKARKGRTQLGAFEVALVVGGYVNSAHVNSNHAGVHRTRKGRYS